MLHYAMQIYFQFLTFGDSDAQSWAPECPNIRNWKWYRLGLYGTEHLKCNHLMTLGFKGLREQAMLNSVLFWSTKPGIETAASWPYLFLPNCFWTCSIKFFRVFWIFDFLYQEPCICLSCVSSDVMVLERIFITNRVLDVWNQRQHEY